MATHWKKLTNPNYLGSYAFNQGEEKTATIKVVRQETVTGADGGTDECIVCYFKEDILPLILNKTNCKLIEKQSKTPYIEEWAGLTVTMRVQKVKAFGDVVDAVRIKSVRKGGAKAEPERVIKCVDCGNEITAIGGYTATDVAKMNKSRFGREICGACSRKIKEQQEAEQAASEPETNDLADALNAEAAE